VNRALLYNTVENTHIGLPHTAQTQYSKNIVFICDTIRGALGSVVG
jgi:hypothetical protein